ncbi:ketopantoate reductase family protein [Salinirubellus sp. GCM10025818]|uniref:ketopantoate reductase family protein n=1 Tax=Salinirubellus TaxID=2162630 RepID=UPI0030D2A943
MTSIAVYGAGGVGAYFGGRLARAGADVSLIARGEHLAALREEGLRVESVHGDFAVDLAATDDPSDIGHVDYVLVCVKSFDTGTLDLDPLVGEDTCVISLQNGVRNERLLAEAVGEDRVLGGLCYILSTIKEPGVVEHTGGPAQVVFGELDGAITERAERFRDRCEEAGIDVTLSADVRADMWEKFAFIVAHAGMTAAVRLPVGPIRESEAAWAMYERMLREVVAVGNAEGVSLPEGVVEERLDRAAELDADAYSSLHYDLTHGKRMELDAFHGTVVDLAEEHDIDVPACEAVYAILDPWAERNARSD